MIVGVKNRMVDMILFETELPFASTCSSTWPHCASVTPYIADEGATVPQASLTQMLERPPELVFGLVQFYGASTMWSVSQTCSIKPTCCQNDLAKSHLWMHLHQFQYLLPVKFPNSFVNIFITVPTELMNIICECNSIHKSLFCDVSNMK